ncbi:MAG: hypothetical protein WAK03_09980 [Methylocystis sp.]
MAMTNSERQAKWRARLKAKAAVGGASIEQLFRERIQTVLLREADLANSLDDDEREVWLEAASALLAKKDDELRAVLNDLIHVWHRDECVDIANVRRKEAMQAARRKNAGRRY